MNGGAVKDERSPLKDAIDWEDEITQRSAKIFLRVNSTERGLNGEVPKEEVDIGAIRPCHPYWDIRVSQFSPWSEYITGRRTLTLRKLDQEPLLDAGILLCGSLLEAMAVG